MRTILLLPIGILALAGCGGVSKALGIADDAVNLNTDKTSVAYGEAVKIAWSTSGLNTSTNNGFVSSNFADVFQPLSSSGNVTDHPLVTTTYQMRVRKESGAEASDSVTVQVLPGTRRFLIVGGSGSAAASTARTLLAEASSIQADITSAIPASSGSYDALILVEGGSFGPADQSKVTAWLSAGKGVIVVGAAANQLATGSTSNTNTSSITSWFGGVTQCEKYGDDEDGRLALTDSNIGTSLTTRDWTKTASGREVRWQPWARISNVGAAVKIQCEGSRFNSPIYLAWSFKHGSGRVYFIAGLSGPVVQDIGKEAELREVFIPGARWAAGD